MARIYKCSDRIPVKIDSVLFKISPLTFEQKAEIQHYMLGFTTGDIRAATKGTALAVKYAVKDVKGLQDSKGKSYKLEFDGEVLSDNCVSDLMNVAMSNKLTIVCASMVGGMPDKFTDGEGKKLEGVEIVEDSDPKS
jgi:hypothetical protein